MHDESKLLKNVFQVFNKLNAEILVIYHDFQVYHFF